MIRNRFEGLPERELSPLDRAERDWIVAAQNLDKASNAMIKSTTYHWDAHEIHLKELQQEKQKALDRFIKLSSSESL